MPAANGLQAWLINLDLQCPPGAEHFERVLEIVSGHEDDKTAARQRWREYQQAGHELHAHDLSQKKERAQYLIKRPQTPDLLAYSVICKLFWTYDYGT